MLARWTKPGSDEQGAEVVAIQGDGVRLVIGSRTADVGCRGMLKEFFLDGVSVEPGDGARTRSRTTCARSFAKLEITSRAQLLHALRNQPEAMGTDTYR